MNELMFIIMAGLVGLIVGYFITKSSINSKILMLENQLKLLGHDQEQLKLINNKLSDEKHHLHAKLLRAEGLYEQAQTQSNQVEHQLYEKSAALNKANEEKVSFYEKLKHAREKLDNQQNDILRLREQFRLEFSELAQKILDDNSKKFTESNEQKIKQILEPLKSNISDFRQKVEDTYDKESKERFSLGKEVHRLIEMSQVVSREANNLTTALKGNNKVQGNWGEMILESLLAQSGLTKGREYFLQQFIRDNAGNIVKDENGRGLQPDVTIYYPDDRKIIIDSKVSLLAWEQCVGCDDKEQQRQFLFDHSRSLKQHIDGLSKKNYPRYALALDYVLLFIPVEPAFLEAVKTDMNLWKYAYEKKILLVSPTNLFAVLKIIADLWKVEQQNRNAIEIADKAGALYDKFVGFVDNMESVGRKLEDATDCYTEAFKQLSSGKGNIIGKIEELKKMGAKAGKQLPEKLFQETGEAINFNKM
jgi:DNA recombination protein RmuC